jgi:TPR repeat protein
MRITIVIACLVAVSPRAQADVNQQKIAVAVLGCERGDGKKCMQAAVEMERQDVRERLGYTAKTLRQHARRLFGQQCDESDAIACLAQGKLYLADGAEDKGFEIIERACSLGSGEACLLLGNLDSKGGDSLVMFDRACARGTARACVRLSEQLERQKRVSAADRRRIAELDRKACEGEDAVGCMRTGLARRAAGDKVGALIALGKACDFGEARACDPAGQLVVEPKGARVLYLRSCDAGISSGCKHLSEHYAKGTGGDRNWGRAIALAETACRLDKVSPCAAAAKLRQTPPPWKCAGEKECKALCDEGIGRSCRRLAELRGGAVADYERGCEVGDATSCTLRGHAAETLVDGAKWYKLGCRAGDRTACPYAQLDAALDGSDDARELLVDQCKTDLSACVLLGLAVMDKQPAEAEKHWRAACAKDQGVACRLVAIQLESDRRRTRSTREEANQLMKRACKRGDSVACKALSTFEPPRPPTVPAWV